MGKSFTIEGLDDKPGESTDSLEGGRSGPDGGDEWFEALLDKDSWQHGGIAFEDPELEQSFRQYIEAHGMRVIRSYLWFVMVISALFIAADYFFYGWHPVVVGCRVLIFLVIVYSMVAVAFFPRFYWRNYENNIMVVNTLAFVAISIISLTGGSDIGFNWGQALFTPFALFVLRPRFVYALVTCVIPTVGYFVAALVTEPAGGPLEALLHTSTLVCVVSFFLVILQRLERLLRRRFLLSQHFASRRARTGTILRKMLPPAVLDDALAGRRIMHKQEATVVFIAVHNFHDTIDSMTPSDAVALLDDLYSRLDELAEAFAVQKLETVMDVFVCVCGLPTARDKHVQRAAAFACEAVRVISVNFPGLALRVGMDSGVTVGGVVGIKRRFYRAFGNPVNTSARLCSKARPGEVLVCKTDTADLLRQEVDGLWAVGERGRVDLKGLGKVQIFSVEFKGSTIPRGTGLVVIDVANGRGSTGSLSDSDNDGDDGNEDDEKASQAARRRTLIGEFEVHKVSKNFVDRDLERQFQRRIHSGGSTVALVRSCRMWMMPFAVGLAIATPIREDMGELDALVSFLLQVLVIAIIWMSGLKSSLETHSRMVKTWTFVTITVPMLVMLSLHLPRDQDSASFGVFFLVLLVFGSQLSYGPILAAIALNFVALVIVSPDTAAFALFGYVTMAVVSYFLLGSMSLRLRRDFVLLIKIKREERAYSTMVSDLLPRSVFREIQQAQEEKARLKAAMKRTARSKLATSLPGTLEDTDTLSSDGSVSTPRTMAKDNVMRVARAYPEVVVLQLDLAGSTRFASSAEPESVYEYLNTLFTRFDTVTQELGTVKYDSAGDGYKVIAGMFEKESLPELLQRVIATARKFREIVKSTTLPDGNVLECRIGIASGVLFGGVFGKTVPKFNVWGAAIEDADALEQSCPTGGISVQKRLAEMAQGDGLRFRPAGITLETVSGVIEEPLLLEG